MKSARVFLGAVVLAMFTGVASAAPVSCANDPGTRNYMLVDDSLVMACIDSGVGNIGQGGGNDVFLSGANAGDLTLISQYFTFTTANTATGSTGTFTIPDLWASWEDLYIGFKFGTGNTPDEWFVYSLVEGITTGSWNFFLGPDGRGGGLSHIVLYGDGPEFRTPEPGSLALLGMALVGLGLIRRRRRI